MRWFKHLTRAHLDESITPILAKVGPEGYGIYWIICEVVGESMDKSERCSVSHPFAEWRRKLYISSRKVESFLQLLEKNHLIKFEISGENITVSVPKLLKYRDEYSKKSGETPDTGLPPNPESVRSKDTDTDTQTDNTNGFAFDETHLDAADPNAPRKPKRERWFDEELWPIVWLKKGRGGARKAFLAKAKNEATKDKIVSQAKKQGPGILRSAVERGHSILLVSTWLNDERYDDEISSPTQTLIIPSQPHAHLIIRGDE